MINRDDDNPVTPVTKDDFSLIKELIGSALYFNRLSQYAAVVEDKFRVATSWKMLALLEFEEEKGCFINHRETGRMGPASLDFYAFNSPIIRETKGRTDSLLRKLEPPVEDSYERKLIQEKITYICLAPIVIKERFIGIVVGFATEDHDIPLRDRYLLEVVAEIVGLSHEKFFLRKKNEKLSKQVKDLRNQLVNVESLKIMGELNAGAAHNLNNMLAAILGYVQLIDLKTDDPEIEPLLQEIRSAVMQGKETVRNLQEFRKMDLDASFDVVQAEEVIKRAVALTRSKWQDEAWAKNVDYKIEMDFRDAMLVQGNPSTLLEAFIIILFKCLESIPSGGKITIETFLDNKNAGIAFTTAREIKMSEGMLALDPFIQPREGSSMTPSLAVADEIIHRHEGTLNRETKIGHGTIITVKIPLMEQASMEMSQQAPTFQMIPARILVVEDEPIVRSLLRDVLKAEGFNIITAEDGRNALEILGDDKEFDIIITDLGMPVMSGFDLVERVRKMIPDIPIIMATGWEAQIDRKKVEKYRINSVVGKPFQFNDLIETILACLSNKNYRA